MKIIKEMREFGLHSARRPSRCQQCGLTVRAGDLIARAADGHTLPSNVSTRAQWAHAKCIAKALVAQDDNKRRQARSGYRLRALRRKRKAKDSKE